MVKASFLSHQNIFTPQPNMALVSLSWHLLNAIFLEQGESRSEKGTCCLHRCRTLLPFSPGTSWLALPTTWRPRSTPWSTVQACRMANKRGAASEACPWPARRNAPIGKCWVEPNQHATSAFRSYVDSYGPPVHHLTSLRSQKCILKVCEPEWHIVTSLRTGSVFYSFVYIGIM